MTVLSQPAFDWDRDPRTKDLWDEAPYEGPSPNLLELTRFLRINFGGGSQGIHWDRPSTSNSKIISEHSWGAALDHGTGERQVEWMQSVGVTTGPPLTVAQHHAMCDWVVAHSAELQIDAIVSIGRSWKSDRVNNGAGGWQPYDSGYDGHSHFVTSYEGFHNATPIEDRLAPPPTPTPPPETEDDDMMELFLATAAIRVHKRTGAVFLTSAIDFVQHIDQGQWDHYLAMGVKEVELTNEDLFESYVAYLSSGARPKWAGKPPTAG